MKKPITLAREEIRQIFNRFRGASMALASELGVGRSAITNWLNGKPSQRIERAAQAKAVELLLGCKEPDKLCVPCPLRPICETLAKQRPRRSGSGKRSKSR